MSIALLRRLTAPALAVTLIASVLVGVAPATSARATTAATTTTAAPSALTSGWTPRGEDYPRTVTRTDLAIPMSDGVVLRGDLVLPATADGVAAPGPFPVVVTITAYNKTVLSASPLGGAGPDYLVKRGYAQLTVDARGTGSSGGGWAAFSERENTDAGEIIAWAHAQSEWSNGAIAMSGPSYMGISQLFAAGNSPPGLKALFPQVPGADVYRDVVASGGQLDVGFIPLWLGLVTATGLIPPAYTLTDPAGGVGTLLEHVLGATSFTLPLLLQALLGLDAAYDGPFYEERSPINVIDRVDVPTFFVGGQYDLFQRGTPLLFENLRERGVPTKFIFGPWDHLEGSSGEHIADAGYGTLPELQLRWFDRHVRGLPDPGLDRDIAPLTYHEIGTGDWLRSDVWLGDHQSARSLRLSGTSSTAQASGGLTDGPTVESGVSDVFPIPVAGLCTRSASQWTAGVPNLLLPGMPCFTDNALNDNTGVVFETEPLTAPLTFQGPLNARLYTSSISGDGMLSVSVSDVAPDGTVDRISGGWQVLSHRALDSERTRYLDGEVIQPFHPFTRAAKRSLGGAIEPIDVEIFPTAAQIKPGHRLRVAIQAFDVPHLLPTLPDLLGTLTVLRIHNSAEHPSRLILPEVVDLPEWPADAATPDGADDEADQPATPGRSRAATRTRAVLRAATTARGASNRVRIRVRRVDGRPATGRVRVRVARRPVATVRLNARGRAVVRLPRQRSIGRTRVVVRYLGNPTTRPSRAAVSWRVRAR